MSAIQLLGDMEIRVPMKGLIDAQAEVDRIGREIEKLSKDLGRVRGKLNNSSFIDKAPAAVVEKERGKLAGLETAKNTLVLQLQQMHELL